MANPVTKHPAVVTDVTNRQLANARAGKMRDATKIMNRFCKHALGKCKLTNSQIRAGEVVLRKVWPDLSALQIIDDADEYANLSREELANRAAGIIAANPAIALLTQLSTAIDMGNLVAENPAQEEIEEAEIIPIKGD